MSVIVSNRVQDWRAAWQGRNADRVAALYLADATHMSARVAELMPDLQTDTLKGRNQVRAFAAESFRRLQRIEFEILSVTEEAERSAIEYLAHTDPGPPEPRRVVEILEWSGPLIQAARVFHF